MSRSEAGTLGFSVLLFQDLAVIPALALVPLLAGSADEHVNWLTVGMKVLGFAGTGLADAICCGRCSVLSPARGQGGSLPPRCCWSSDLVPCLWRRWGCRMALGTFIAGVLAESEYRIRTGDRYRSVQGAASGCSLFPSAWR